MSYTLYASEFTLSEVEGLNAIRYAIRNKPHAIRDTTTNSYVRNYKLFLQNEPNFQKSQTNVTVLLKREYGQMDTWWSGKKQTQTNPNKAKSKKAKMNVTFYITKGYENKSPIRAQKNKAKLRNDKKQCKLFYHKGL